MACGTPVVTRPARAIEEVAGGAAVLVDPLDRAAIAAGIERGDGAPRRARRPGSSAPARSRGSARADSVVELWRELA